MHEIFISYSRRDLATVRALTTALTQNGVTVWVDRSDIQEGDVLMANHPTAGGSCVCSVRPLRVFLLSKDCRHLPDITVITPVYQKGELVFFTGESHMSLTR